MMNALLYCISDRGVYLNIDSITTFITLPQRVDDRKLATLLGVTRKAVTFATPAQCVEHLGYAPGSVPPVGHRQKPHVVYLDDALQRYTHVYPAGGANNAIFGVTLAQLVHLSGGTFVDVKRDP